MSLNLKILVSLTIFFLQWEAWNILYSASRGCREDCISTPACRHCVAPTQLATSLQEATPPCRTWLVLLVSSYILHSILLSGAHSRTFVQSVMLFNHAIFGRSLFPVPDKVSWITLWKRSCKLYRQYVCAVFWRCSRWHITGSRATVRASAIAAVSQSRHTTESPAVTVAGVKFWSVIIHALHNSRFPLT